jgi:uncharacterized protein (DUF433 family)
MATESVVVNPAVRDGRPVIGGTRLCVSDLAAHHTVAGLTPDQLARQFNLELGQVYAALAYYYQHKDDVDAEIERGAEEASPEVRTKAAERQPGLMRLVREGLVRLGLPNDPSLYSPRPVRTPAGTAARLLAEGRRER